MKTALCLFLTCALTACAATGPTSSSASTAPSTVTQNDSESPARFLIAVAAKDFHRSPAHPTGFRNVRLGHVQAPDGKQQYFLCGEFQAAAASERAEWTAFTTIKTLGYEQLLGSQASGLCKRPSVTWVQSGDFTSALQIELSTLRKAGADHEGV